MSSFICSTQTFDNVERTLKNFINWDDLFHCPYELRTITPRWYNKRKLRCELMEEEIDGLFSTIRELNVLCVSLQYKHHYKGTLDDEIKTQLSIIREKKEGKKLSKVQLYKQIVCISYQIEIDHLKELRELTEEEERALTFLKKIEDYLAHHIVSSSKEYQDANWD